MTEVEVDDVSDGNQKLLSCSRSFAGTVLQQTDDNTRKLHQEVREFVLVRSEQIGQETHRLDLRSDKLAESGTVLDLLCNSCEDSAVRSGFFVCSLLRTRLELEGCLDPWSELGNVVGSELTMRLEDRDNDNRALRYDLERLHTLD